MDAFMSTGEKVLSSMPFFAAIGLLLFIGKVIYDFVSPYNANEELTEKDNPAFGVAMCGFLGGLAIALGGLSFGFNADNPTKRCFAAFVHSTRLGQGRFSGVREF